MRKSSREWLGKGLSKKDETADGRQGEADACPQRSSCGGTGGASTAPVVLTHLPPSPLRSVVSDGGSGDPDCVVMPGLQLTGGQQYYFFLSDADLLQFVVPASLVESFAVTPAGEAPAAA